MDLSPLWISIKTALTATFLAFVSGIIVAKFMSTYQGRFKSMLDSVLVLPLVLPPTVVGFLLLVLLGKNSFLGKLLALLGATVIFSWTATVIASTIVSFPLMYRATLGSFEQVDPNLLDAARTIGVPERSIFTRITIPLAWPGIAAGTILAFARALGEFGATLMLAGNIPGKTQTIPLAIFFLVESGRQSGAVIWVLVIIFISLIVITCLHYWTKRQTLATNRKGQDTACPW